LLPPPPPFPPPWLLLVRGSCLRFVLCSTAIFTTMRVFPSTQKRPRVPPASSIGGLLSDTYAKCRFCRHLAAGVWCNEVVPCLTIKKNPRREANVRMSSPRSPRACRSQR
ncbi:unnamed protein product, partial [Scytosiphon promiscuus]